MTETEWLNGTDPEPVLAFLKGPGCERKDWHGFRWRKGLPIDDRSA